MFIVQKQLSIYIYFHKQKIEVIEQNKCKVFLKKDKGF